jgi:hypothetical protein
MKSKARWLLLGPLAALVCAGDAYAIIGRPLTPMSYAGVARRTARRSAVYGAAVGASVGAAAGVAAMPAGCAVGLPCYGTVYRPVYQGATVVYVSE